MPSKKIIDDLDHSNHHIGTITGDYMLDQNDPKYKAPPLKSEKVLTKKRKWNIIKPVIKRKDDNPMTNKKTKKLPSREIAVALLAIPAVGGIAQWIGTGLHGTIAAAFIVLIVAVYALDLK